MAAGAGYLRVAAAAGALYQSPPELIRVAAGYSAKIVCSNVFIAGRDPDDVLKVDVQAPGHWILEYILVDVDREAKTVTAGLLGIFGKGTAVARDGFGCTSVPDEKLADVLPVPAWKQRRRQPTRCGRRATAFSRRRTRPSPQYSTTTG